jgi:hypothetical protein
MIDIFCRFRTTYVVFGENELAILTDFRRKKLAILLKSNVVLTYFFVPINWCIFIQSRQNFRQSKIIKS